MNPIRCLLAALALAWMACLPALAQPLADPRLDWFTADSEHFRLHYREGQRARADAVARAAEKVYPRVTQALNWQPRSRTEIVLYSEYDIANGFTTPLPFDLIGVFLAPPDEGQLLDNSEWLDLLLVHEFTHAVHLDKVRGVPRILQAIFGNQPWFIPNLFQPGWALEGLAVYNESEPAAGRGRLKGPMFEAWLRAEKAAGFLSLREINSDGRALPLSKQYLYGAYFFEFLARRYGADKVPAYVEQYSGNIVPRLHTNPYDMTGKTMDLLWDEFLVDLGQQVDERSAALRATPEVLGTKLAGPLLDIPTVAALPDGALLAVVEDGLNGAWLVRFEADGTRRDLVRVNSGARLDVAPDGRVLVAQYDVCNTLYVAYDLYRLDGSSLSQLTSCAHLRRAVQAGNDIVALQLDGGLTKLVKLAGDGGSPTPLYTAPEGSDLVDLAASRDGRRVSAIVHRGADWRIVEFDLQQPAAAPRLLLRRDAPLYGLRQGAAGLEVIAAVDGVYNVWRLLGGQLQRLTHTHTAVVAQGGSAADGALASVVIAPQGYALYRRPAAAPLQSLAADSSAPAATPATAPAASPLGEARSYSALRSMYPRSWFPAITSDRGLTAYGASTSGADALGWHQYLALLEWETSQKEVLGSFEYVFAGSHGLALERTLTPRAWTGDKGDETTTVYDRRTKAQWLSLLPWTRIERRINFGIGAALDRTERVDAVADTRVRPIDERVAALLADFDTSNGDWYSEGANRGLHATLLYESYKPFKRDQAGLAPDYDGGVLRADLRGYLPLIGRSVLALRWTEARANGSTAPFQLGGATDRLLQIGYVLNDRELSLRGYRGDEPELLGQNARVASAELRFPLADIDRHTMVPPFGINRLSAAVFFDAGGAWNGGANGPDRWRRGAGFELLGEIKLLYALGLQLRAGVARGLDEPRDTRAYLSLGRAF